jgi:hypothetical protein
MRRAHLLGTPSGRSRLTSLQPHGSLVNRNDFLLTTSSSHSPSSFDERSLFTPSTIREVTVVLLIFVLLLEGGSLRGSGGTTEVGLGPSEWDWVVRIRIVWLMSEGRWSKPGGGRS